ncbi:MAG: S8 family serine peptidase [Phycisphaerales bacterium]
MNRQTPHDKPRPTSELGALIELLEPRELLAIDVPWVNGPLWITTTASAVPLGLPSATVSTGGGWGSGGLGFWDDGPAESLISLDAFRNDPRFAGIDGHGGAVAVLDTGIDLNHPFFGPDADGDGVADRIVYHQDFANGDASAADFNGHGSHVSSIIGSGDPTRPGVAPGADLIHLKVFTDAGPGTFAFVERALQWVVTNAVARDIVAVNMSLVDSQNHAGAISLYGIGDELRALAELGVIVVSAAGNAFSSFAGAPGVAYPAADPWSLAVGAVFSQSIGGVTYGSGAQAFSSGPDRLAPFSQRSVSLIDIFAPGAPVSAAGPTGGTMTLHGTSQAAPHVAGVVALLQQLAQSVLGRKLSFGEFRDLLAETGDVVIDGDDEDDNVPNTGAAFRRLDVLALAEAVLSSAPPQNAEIAVRDSGANVIDGTGHVTFDPTQQGTPVFRTITVVNLGLEPLTLAEFTTPAGFSVVSGFGAATLAAGASTAFTVRLNATGVGTITGTLSFENNDADENTFDIVLTGAVSGPTTFIDDGGAGFTQVGPWTTTAGGYLNDGRTTPSGGGANIAAWTFPALPAGLYRVSVTFAPETTHATNALFTIHNGAITAGKRFMNQRVAPDDRTDQGRAWEDVGVFHLNAGHPLIVRLTNKANGPVIADGVRVERVGNLPAGPEVMLFQGETELGDGIGAVGFGVTAALTSVTRVFTVANVGGANLVLNPAITLPAGYALAAGLGSTVLAPGTTAMFSVRLVAASVGAFSGGLVLDNNDANEGPFNVTLTGSVAAIFRDDGDPGFASVGTWSVTSGGHLNDTRSAGSGTGSGAATWTFAGLTAGRYRVSITYKPGGTRATNAPITLFNGATSLGTIAVNQRLLIQHRFDANRWWRDLGEFDITSGTLVLRLNNLANGSVVADGVRIEPL